jgi:hypothetical protein
MPEQTISPSILEQLPRYVVSDYQTFASFLQAYYEWMETTGQVYDRATSILSYRDIDRTLDEFVTYFEKEFLVDIPTKLYNENGVVVNKATLVKHIREFYKARGTEKSYKLLFRILFNEDVEFYYPKVDMLYASDGKWSYDTVLRCTSNNDPFSFIGKSAVGLTSGATAAIENVFQYQVGADLVSELYVSNVFGTFLADEQIQVGTEVETLYSMVSGIVIDNPGTNYRVGDTIVIAGGGANASGAEASVVEVRGSIREDIQIIDGGYGYNDVPDVTIIGTGFGARATAVLTPTGIRQVDILNSSSGHDPNDPPIVEFVADEVTITLSNLTGLFTVDEYVMGTNSGSSALVSDFYFSNGSYFLKLIDSTGVFEADEVLTGDDSLATANATNITPYGATGIITVSDNGYIEAINVLDSGSGYTKPPRVQVIRPNTTIDEYIVTKLWLDGTTVASITVDDVGRDYTSEGGLNISFENGHLDPTNSRHAIALGDIAGKISRVTIINPGVGYSEIPTVVFAYASGSGATATASIGASFTSDGRFLNTDGFISSDKYIQDSFYYQVYSYVLKSTQSTSQYRNIVNRVLHPAGLLLFGTTVLTSFFQIGPMYRSVEGEKFKYMPNAEFLETFPAPNAGYWTNDGFANSQINHWMDTIVGDVIDGPLVRVNHEPDVYLYAYNPTYAIPQNGNVVEYDFIQRVNPQILDDIGPSPAYNGILGSSSSIDISDPEWVGTGMKFQGTYVNCSAAPINPLTQSIVVVARVDALDNKSSIIGCIDSDNEANCTGYSIDVDVDGSLIFRTQKRVSSPTATHTLSASYPAGTINIGEWFYAVLRYSDNTLTGNLNEVAAVQSQFLVNVDVRGIQNNSKGYYIGNQGYVKPISGGSFYGGIAYGDALYGAGSNTQIVYTPVPTFWNESLWNGKFFDGLLLSEITFVQPIPGQPLLNGIVGYCIIYDRALIDEEVDAIFHTLKTGLLSRPITLP